MSFNVEVSYPDGTTSVTSSEVVPTRGQEFPAPGWFVTACVPTKERFIHGFPVDFEVTVATEPPRSEGPEEIVAE